MYLHKKCPFPIFQQEVDISTLPGTVGIQNIFSK